jgi:hypothetical protein
VVNVKPSTPTGRLGKVTLQTRPASAVCVTHPGAPGSKFIASGVIAEYDVPLSDVIAILIDCVPLETYCAWRRLAAGARNALLVPGALAWAGT